MLNRRTVAKRLGTPAPGGCTWWGVPKLRHCASRPLPEGFSLRHSPPASDCEGHSLNQAAENFRLTRVYGATLRQALSVWPRIALLTFGSPAVQLAAMYRILVEEKRWISRDRFLNALNYCLALPGPDAQLLA